MDVILKNIKDSSINIKLDTNERVSARETLLMFMNENPLKSEKSLPSYQPILISNVKSPYVKEKWLTKYKNLVQSALIVLIVFALGTGVYAEKTVPGNILYGVKTGVNENLRSFFSFTNVQQTNYNINAIERRLSEGEKLSIDGGLTQEKVDDLTNSISQNLSKIDELVSESKRDTDFGLALNVLARTEVLLKGHGAVFSERSVQTTDSLQGTSAMLVAILDKINQIDKSRLEIESGLLESSDSNIELKIPETLKSTEKLLALRESYSENMISFNQGAQAPIAKMALMNTETPIEDSTANKLNRARDLYNKSNDLFQTKKYGEATILLTESNRLLQEIDLMAQLTSKYKMNVFIPDDPSSDRFEMIFASSTQKSFATTTVSKDKKVSTPTSPTTTAQIKNISSSTNATSSEMATSTSN